MGSTRLEAATISGNGCGWSLADKGRSIKLGVVLILLLLGFELLQFPHIVLLYWQIHSWFINTMVVTEVH